VSVADDGPGIPDHERAVLTDGEETALEHGSGLGLWLVHWVVERSGGRLSFAENDPRGSVVRMDLRPASED
jgi:signal transduction histidine kinase